MPNVQSEDNDTFMQAKHKDPLQLLDSPLHDSMQSLHATADLVEHADTIQTGGGSQ